MRTRCHRCGKIGSTRYACVSCGSARTMNHCHNRAHRTHTLRGEAIGYEGESLGRCTDSHVHEYQSWRHLDAPDHDVTTA